MFCFKGVFPSFWVDSVSKVGYTINKLRHSIVNTKKKKKSQRKGKLILYEREYNFQLFL